MRRCSTWCMLPSYWCASFFTKATPQMLQGVLGCPSRGDPKSPRRFSFRISVRSLFKESLRRIHPKIATCQGLYLCSFKISVPGFHSFEGFFSWSPSSWSGKDCSSKIPPSRFLFQDALQDSLPRIRHQWFLSQDCFYRISVSVPR